MGIKVEELIECIEEAIAKVRTDYEENGKDLPNLRKREICQELGREIGKEAMLKAKKSQVLKKEQSLIAFAAVVAKLVIKVLCKNVQKNNSSTMPSWPLPEQWEEIINQVLEKTKKKGGENDKGRVGGIEVFS